MTGFIGATPQPHTCYSEARSQSRALFWEIK